jgi:hypothetical protein
MPKHAREGPRFKQRQDHMVRWATSAQPDACAGYKPIYVAHGWTTGAGSWIAEQSLTHGSLVARNHWVGVRASLRD